MANLSYTITTQTPPRLQAYLAERECSVPPAPKPKPILSLHHWTDERQGGMSVQCPPSRYLHRVTGIGWLRPVGRLRWMQARRRRG